MKTNEMLKRFIEVLLLIPFMILSLTSCSKEEEINLTNDRTTAVFNPDVNYGTLTDQSGNIYKTVTIGTQVWMAENLRTTKYNDGTDIPNEIKVDMWSILTTAAYCNYNTNNYYSTIATYGRLYNGYSVATGKLAPQGWHVPTFEEWQTLINYLGGYSLEAAFKLRETGITHYSVGPGSDPNLSTNESGFTAIYAGIRKVSPADYIGRKSTTTWWTSNPDLSITLDYNSSIHINWYHDIKNGYSVRCIKD